MKVYIAGPMTGIKSFNVPQFDAMALALRVLGYDVVSPAELDGAETRAIIMASKTGSHDDLPPGETWGFYLARDVKMLADDGIAAVVVLPGFASSPGAVVETFIARRIVGLPIYYLDPSTNGLCLVPPSALIRAWTNLPELKDAV